MTKPRLFAACALVVAITMAVGLSVWAVAGVLRKTDGSWEREEEARESALRRRPAAVQETPFWEAPGYQGMRPGQEINLNGIKTVITPELMYEARRQARVEASQPRLEVRYYDEWGRRIGNGDSRIPRPVWTQDGFVQPIR